MKKIRLLRSHTHSSQIYQQGETIEVLPIFGDWLVSQGIGEYVEQKSSTKKTDTTTVQKSTAPSDAAGEP